VDDPTSAIIVAADGIVTGGGGFGFPPGSTEQG
jgi:hypothetical protein